MAILVSYWLISKTAFPLKPLGQTAVLLGNEF
jgi:hypothetical protein